MGTLLRTLYGLFWLYVGAILAVANGFETYAIGLGALTGLAFGHMIRMVIEVIIHYAGFGNDK